MVFVLGGFVAHKLTNSLPKWRLSFIPFPISLIKAKNRFVKNGTANFGRNIPTEISGPPLEVIPNIPVGIEKPKRTLPFEFRHNGKHPLGPFG